MKPAWIILPVGTGSTTQIEERSATQQDSPQVSETILQLLREWPPGFGGVERVAHELASVWGGRVYSFDSQRQAGHASDPCLVTYPRQVLPCCPPVARLRLPWPSQTLGKLLLSSQHLHGHLPSPGVLLLLVTAKVLNPRRRVTAHWHSFLERSPGLSGRLFLFYQWLALRLLPLLDGVITTSPVLAEALIHQGCRAKRVQVLPCCLSSAQEQQLLAIPARTVASKRPMRVLFIGRLASYKRLDWLLIALAELKQGWELHIVGDGPHRDAFQHLSHSLMGPDAPVTFLGQLDEATKLQQIARADVLVLPSDRSNEAFGIVQLEAMAAGIPALAFERKRSGMGWVCQLEGLQWTQTPENLSNVLSLLMDDPQKRHELGLEARKRYQELFARPHWLNTLQAWTQSPPRQNSAEETPTDQDAETQKRHSHKHNTTN